MENEAPKTSEQIELEAAMQRLSEAKQAVAIREKMLLDKSAADLAAHRAAEEAKLVEVQRERARIENFHAEKKAAKQAAEEAERQTKAAEQRRLEMEFAAREADLREKEKHEQELKRVQDAAFALEMQAKGLEGELSRSTPVPAVDSTSYTAPLAEVTASTDTGGRERLMQRTLGVQSQLAEQKPEPAAAPQDFRGQYEVRDGLIPEAAFAVRLTTAHPEGFFISPSSGELILGGYRWKIEDNISVRVWQHSTTVYVAQDASGYVLRKCGTSDAVKVTPISTVEGLIWQPLPDHPAPTCSLSR